MRTILLAGVAVAALTSAAAAQGAVNMNVSATFNKSATWNLAQPLLFGTIIAGSQAGTVTVGLDGRTTASGGATAGVGEPGQVRVLLPTGYTGTVGLDAGSTAVNLINNCGIGSDNKAADGSSAAYAVTVLPRLSLSQVKATNAVAGTAMVVVGGTLNMPANVAACSYTGVLTLNIAEL